jgi:hypothetical protein
MIYLHRTKGTGDELAEMLRELCVAHDTVWLDGPDAAASPFLVEGSRRYAGADIPPFLDLLRAETRVNRTVSGDACYIDPRTGRVC